MSGDFDNWWLNDVPVTLLATDPFSVAETVERMEPGTRFIETDALGRRHGMMRVFSGVVFDNGDAGRPVHYGDSAEDGATIEVTHRPLAMTVDGSEVERTARAWRPYAFAEPDYTHGGLFPDGADDGYNRADVDERAQRSRAACISIVREVLEAQSEGARQ